MPYAWWTSSLLEQTPYDQFLPLPLNRTQRPPQQRTMAATTPAAQATEADIEGTEKKATMPTSDLHYCSQSCTIISGGHSFQVLPQSPCCWQRPSHTLYNAYSGERMGLGGSKYETPRVMEWEAVWI